jgi:ABC-2 type transport system permease protein
MAARILRLWALYAYLDGMWIARDFRSFIFYYLADAVTAVASVAGVLLLAQRFDGIPPWTRDQVVFLLGFGMVARFVPDMLGNYNVLHISRRIGRGQLDHILVQPQPVWMALLTEGFAPFWGLLSLAPGVGLMVWAGQRMGLEATPPWLLAFALNLAGASAALTAYAALWGFAAFFQPRAAEEISGSAVDLMTDLKGFPLDALGPGLRTALVTVIPAGLMAWYPCRALLGLDHGIAALWATPAAAAALCCAACLTFRMGMKRYAQVGSSRYTSFGHRR